MSRSAAPAEPAAEAEAAAGDPAAFVGRHQSGVWRFLRFCGADPALAEELAQEALVRGWRHGLVGRPHATAAAWLRTTARRLLASHHRATARRDAAALPLDGVDEAALETAWIATHGRDADGAGYLAALDACLATLDDRARHALDLCYRDGAGRAAMAAALGVSEAGIKQLLRRTRARLRACIERRLG